MATETEVTVSQATAAGSRGPPRKRLRISQACDYCSKRGIRCQPSAEPELPPRCQNCADFDVPCTYDRPIYKRGQKKRRSSIVPSNTSSTANATTSPSFMDQTVCNPSFSDASEAAEMCNLARAWKAFALASESLIENLIEAYYDTVHAIFPWFHRATLLERIRKREYLENRGFFTSTMAMCALTCTKIRDGAPSSKLTSSEIPNFENFYNAAKDTVPKDLSSAPGMDFIRACGLLALTSMQNGDIASMHCWVGMYHSLSALESLWDESRWQKPISVIELEERRYLFWSFYAFEVFTSIVYGTIIRNREAQSQVRYPSRPPDPIINGLKPSDANTWLTGWNFIIDLYRILEHALDLYKTTGPQLRPELSLFDQLPSNNLILQKVQKMYLELPVVLRTMPSAGVPSDPIGFQAASIQASLALVELVIFSSEQNANSECKCEVARHLLNVFSHIPMAYLKTIGSPLLHYLASVAAILAPATESPPTDTSYGSARVLLLDTAALLESLESGTYQAIRLSTDIRKQVQTIDEYFSGESEDRLHLLAPSLTFVQSSTSLRNSVPSSSHSLDNVFAQAPQEFPEWPLSNLSMQIDSTFLSPLALDNDPNDPSKGQKVAMQGPSIPHSQAEQTSRISQYENSYTQLYCSGDFSFEKPVSNFRVQE